MRVETTAKPVNERPSRASYITHGRAQACRTRVNQTICKPTGPKKRTPAVTPPRGFNQTSKHKHKHTHARARETPPHLSDVKVNKHAGLEGGPCPKVPPHNAVPGLGVGLVKFVLRQTKREKKGGGDVGCRGCFFFRVIVTLRSRLTRSGDSVHVDDSTLPAARNSIFRVTHSHIISHSTRHTTSHHITPHHVTSHHIASHHIHTLMSWAISCSVLNRSIAY